MDAIFTAKSTNFGWARFSGNLTYFGGTKFLGESASFKAAEFACRNTVFDQTSFCAQQTNFQWVKFSGQNTEFTNVKFINATRFARTSFESKTSFTGVDLRKCGFVDVDLKNVEFNLIDWDWKHKLSNETQPELIFREFSVATFNQQGVYKALGIASFVKVTKGDKLRACLKTSEIYRQLKVHYHSKRDFAKAGMFHFREQECKRKACRLPQNFFKWLFLWILRLSCGYGEKLKNVGLTSVALILGFAVAYMFLGLHSVDDSIRLVFKYNLGFNNITPVTKILQDFGTSLMFSIKGFFPLWRFQQYKVIGDFANLIAGLEFLLGAFMIGLFIYVFRRRMEK